MGGTTSAFLPAPGNGLPSKKEERERVLKGSDFSLAKNKGCLFTTHQPNLGSEHFRLWREKLLPLNEAPIFLNIRK